MKINFFESPVGEDDIQAVTEIMRTGMVAEGQEVRKFEENFNIFTTNGEYFPLCVTNGTVALDIALRALGVQPGDDVIVPDFSFIATANCVKFQGANVIFADVDIQNFNINLENIKSVITDTTTAIIVVHLFGNPIHDIQEIADYCSENNITLIEDCAQAHGAMIHNKKVGSFGDAACFSFYATKNLGIGEGGITLFKNEKEYKSAKLYYNHGQSEKYFHTHLGHNFRMTNIAAAIGNTQLSKLNSLNEKRIENAHLYNSLLGLQTTLTLPVTNPGSVNVFHQYTVLVKPESTISRSEIQKLLSEKGIPTAIHYPIPMHKQPYYLDQGYNQKICPNTNYLSENIFSLPIYPDLGEDKIRFICASLLEIIT